MTYKYYMQIIFIPQTNYEKVTPQAYTYKIIYKIILSFHVTVCKTKESISFPYFFIFLFISEITLILPDWFNWRHISLKGIWQKITNYKKIVPELKKCFMWIDIQESQKQITITRFSLAFVNVEHIYEWHSNIA